jgi:predicted cobalt transporter CbtA
LMIAVCLRRGMAAGLLCDFRLSSLGTQLVFWAGLGVIFGLLCERANRRESLGS